MEFNQKVIIALGKLFKDVNLKGERVELNIVKDTIKLASKIGGKILGLESNLLADAYEIKKVSEGYFEHIVELKKAEKAAKELGLDKLEKEAIQAIEHYTKSRERAEEMYASVNAAIKR